MNAPLRREAPCDCADCSRECPECGTDLRDGAQARLEAKLDAERVLRAEVTAQRDALLAAVKAYRAAEMNSHCDCRQSDECAGCDRILAARATAIAAIAAVEGDANVPF